MIEDRRGKMGEKNRSAKDQKYLRMCKSATMKLGTLCAHLKALLPSIVIRKCTIKASLESQTFVVTIKVEQPFPFTYPPHQMTLHGKTGLHPTLHSEMDNNGIRGYWKEILFFANKRVLLQCTSFLDTMDTFFQVCVLCLVQYALLCLLLLHSTHRSSDLSESYVSTRNSDQFFFGGGKEL